MTHLLPYIGAFVIWLCKGCKTRWRNESLGCGDFKDWLVGITTILVMIFISVVLVLLCSSPTVNDGRMPRYKQFTSTYTGENFVFIPLQYETDSFLCFTENKYLHNVLNVTNVDKQRFAEGLYEKNIHQEYIELTSEQYEVLKSNRVVEVPEIKELYELNGLSAVLKEYDMQKLWYTYIQFEQNRSLFIYIAYLCWIEDVMISVDTDTNLLYLSTP